MRISELVTLEIKNGANWIDYSDGILDLNITRGVKGYSAIWETPEAGVLTVQTRNADVDPYANSAVRMGKDIRVKANGNVLFTGRITDINVDYQPKGKPPITTLTCVDMIGTMALHALSDGFTERLGSSMGTYGFFQELAAANTTEIIGFTNPVRELSSLWEGSASNDNPLGTVVTPSGTNALSVAKILAQTQIQFFYADRNNDMYLYSRINRKKDDAIKLQFDSRGDATSYREIELTDNFEVLTNQLSIKNQGFNSNVVPLYTNTYSKNQWGQAKKDFTTQIYGALAAQSSISDDIKNVVFADSVHPSREIYAITWDASLNPTAAATIDILDNVYVYHEVDPQDISRKYGIIGIEHRITDNDWSTKYYLKNHFIYDTNFPTPTITTNHPLGGTINDDITYSISNASSIDLTSATYAWKYATGTVPSNLIGTTFSTAASPVVNYTVSQTGNKNITCTVTDSYGFVKTSAVLTQQVFGAPPTAVTISYTINTQDSAVYTFTATTTDATSYTFYWGDGTTYTTTETSAVHRYSTSGNKNVYVVASNGFGTTQSGTTVINVTVPATPAAQIGTWPLRYIALSHPYQNMSGTGTLIPVYGRLQLNTSNAPSGNPSTDPTVNRALIGSYKTYFLTEPITSGPNGINTLYNGSKINIQSGQTSLSDWTYYTQDLAGGFQNTIIFDMSAPYYDIDNIKLTFKNLSTTQTVSDVINVWATDYVGNTLDNTNFKTINWYKIGTLSSGSIPAGGTSSPSIVLNNSVPSLPLNLQPIPQFSYTIGNSADNRTGDKYTFTTDNFYTASYLWNFGDGTTSTLQNPVKTWSTGGSKTVTLTKYDQYGNAYSGSQTFTVTIIADQLGTTPVRYIKLKQNTFNATDLRYSPMIADFTAKTSTIQTDRLLQRSITLPTSTNVNWYAATIDGVGSGPKTITDNTYVASLNGLYITNRTNLTSGRGSGNSWYVIGFEPRALAAGNTSWEIVFDLGTPRYDIKTLSLAGCRNYVGTSTSTKPTYEVYFSSDNINWTKVANVSHAASMPYVNSWHQTSISYVQSLPLSI